MRRVRQVGSHCPKRLSLSAELLNQAGKGHNCVRIAVVLAFVVNLAEISSSNFSWVLRHSDPLFSSAQSLFPTYCTYLPTEYCR